MGDAEDESSWPKLSCGRRYSPRKKRTNDDTKIRENEAKNVERSSLLENEGFPQLGQGLAKRKLSGTGSGNNRATLTGPLELPDLNELSLEEEKSSRKWSKKPRKSDLVLDFQKVLERQRSLSESHCQTPSTSRPRVKVNASRPIRNPLDSAKVVQCKRGKQMEIPRAKKISPLKRVIRRERDIQKQLNRFKRELFEFEKWKAVAKDVNEIEFDKLTISGDSRSDDNYAREISKLSLFDKDYRVAVSEDENKRLETNSEVAKKFQALIIEKRYWRPEVKYEIARIESTIAARTSSMKICDETGETVDDFDQPEVESGNVDRKPEIEFLRVPANSEDTSTSVVPEIESVLLDSIVKTEVNPGDRETIKRELVSPDSIEINSDVISTSVNERSEPLAEILVEKPEVPAVSSPRHSKKFREYCTNDLTPGLNVATELFLWSIVRLQRRLYERDEVKGRSKRRFYAGFKEVSKHVETRKIKLVVVAPDLEGEPGFGGIFEAVTNLLTACRAREVVCCFALNKRKLGYCTHKKGSVSCIGITNYSSVEENLINVLTELVPARKSHLVTPVSRGSGETIIDPLQLISDDMLLSEKIKILMQNLIDH